MLIESPAIESWRDSPTAWFVVLEDALVRGDYSRAAEAQRELERLGLSVRYRRPANRERRPEVAEVAR